MKDVARNTGCFKDLTVLEADKEVRIQEIRRNPLCKVINRKDSCIRGRIEEDYCGTCGEVLTRCIIR